MRLIDLFCEAWRGVIRWPARAIIPALGIMISTAALISIVSTDQTWERQTWDTYRRKGLGQIRIGFPKGAKAQRSAISPEDLAALQTEVGKIARISWYATNFADLYSPRGNLSKCVVMGISPEVMEIESWGIQEGAGFVPADFEQYSRECLISPQAALKVLGTAKALGRTVRINGYDFKVKGIVAAGRLDMDTEGVVLIPFKSYQEVFRDSLPRLSIMLLVEDVSSLAKAHKRIDRLLSARLGVKSNDASFCRSSWVDLQSALSARRRVRSFLLAAIVLLLLVASFGISSVLIAAAHERTREIGAKRAFGATFLRIYGEMSLEGLIIALAGALAGVVLSFALGYFISRFLLIDISGAYFGSSYTFIKEAISLPPLSGLGVSASAILLAVFTVTVSSLAASFASVFFLGRLAPAQLFRLAGESRAGLLLPLTLLQCLLGVSAVLVLVSIYQGLCKEGLKQIRGLFGTNSIQVSSVIDPENVQNTPNIERRFATLHITPEVVTEIIAEAPEIEEIVTSIGAERSGILVRLPFRESDLEYQHFSIVWGVSDNFFANKFGEQSALVKGRLPTQEELAADAPVCIISEAASEKLYGSNIAVGQEIKISGKSFVIVGVAKFEGGSTIKNVFYPPIRIVTPIESAPGKWFNNPILFEAKIRDERRFAEADRQLKAALRKRLGLPPPAEETAPQQAGALRRGRPVDIKTYVAAKNTFELVSMMEQASYRAALFGLIALLVAAMGVLNILLVSVQEDIREIGLRRALGATKLNVGGKYIGRGLWITLSAGLLGTGTGVLLVKVLQQVSGLPAMVPIRWIIFSSGILILIGMAVSFLPAIIASRIPPATALKYE